MDCALGKTANFIFNKIQRPKWSRGGLEAAERDGYPAGGCWRVGEGAQGCPAPGDDPLPAGRTKQGGQHTPREEGTRSPGGTSPQARRAPGVPVDVGAALGSFLTALQEAGSEECV